MGRHGRTRQRALGVKGCKDVDLQGSHLVALLGRSRLLEDAEGSWRSGLVRVSEQGSLTPIVRIPEDFGLVPEKVVVDDSGFGLAACSEPSDSCVIYRVVLSGE
ncbi:MAG: hypothetical protein Q6L60_09845 [Thermostichus sp. HHBFW_bins_43]